jgi:hypothetical protein
MALLILKTSPSLLYLMESKIMTINTLKNLVILLILIGLTFVPLSFAGAASGVSLFLTPAEGNYKVGDSINVSVMINTGEETINAVKATLNFSENLEVQNVSKSGSILGLWVEDPSYDNTAKTISFGGAGAGTTYKGSAGKLISVTLKAKEAGERKIEFTSSSVKYGAATIEVKSASGGSYTVTVLTPQPRIEEETQGPVLMPEETAEEPTPAEEEIIEEVATPEVAARETITQQSLLASMAVVWGGGSQLGVLIVIIVIGLLALVYFGFKEWKLFQKKKSK